MAVSACPEVVPFGTRMVGPVLLRYGTPEQKAEHLPGILSGETIWCQGYSEPGAGSDLASLSTSAVKDGDDYIVNGSKIWTTQAHIADWMFALVRTSKEEKKQDGITCLLIKMDSPGLDPQRHRRALRALGRINALSRALESALRDVGCVIGLQSRLPGRRLGRG